MITISIMWDQGITITLKSFKDDFDYDYNFSS